MRIFQLIDSLAIGGAERMAVNLANMFSDKNIPNVLVASRQAGPLSGLLTDRSVFKTIGKTKTLDLKAFRNLVQIAKEFNPTHLHVHDSSVFWGIALKLFIPRVQLIWHAHYGGFSSSDQRFGGKLKFIQYGIDYMIAVNEDLLVWAGKEIPRVKRKSFIENFPDVSGVFDKTERVSKTIICVANLKSPKNHHLLIKAFFEFLKNRPDFKLQLVGSCPDPIYLSEVEKLIAEKDLGLSVKIVGEVLDLRPYFESARFAVLASQAEGLPVSLLELGLAKVPILCTKVGQCQDLLDDGKLGYLVPSDDLEAMTTELIAIADNPEEASEKAGSFYQKVKKNYGKENFLKKYTELLELKN
jgi:glycosyltransferase involved in cell wall biosynthesis